MYITRIGIFLAVGLFPLSAGATGVDPASASPAQREQAQARFTSGRELYDAGKYDESVASFRASNDIVASPNARLYLARALRESGKLVDAYAEFARTEAEATSHADHKYDKAAEASATERKALREKLGFVSVQIDHPSEGTTLKVGGTEISHDSWSEPAPVMPGKTQVVVETPPQAPVTQSVDVAAGERKTVSIDAAGGSPAEVASTPPDGDHTKLRTYAYVAGGVGAVGLLTFAVAGIFANTTYSDLKTSCGAGPCPASMSSEVSKGKTEQTLANIGLVVGILGAGVGATLYVLSMPKSKTQTALVLSPACTGLRGSF
jgi:hypothetical protein